MIGTKVNDLGFEDLRKVTWDYREVAIAGSYNDIFVLQYLFDIIECSEDRSMYVVQACNVAEGWIEFIECEGEPVKDVNGNVIFPGSPKMVGDEIVRVKVFCKMKVNILDRKRNVIEVLDNYELQKS